MPEVEPQYSGARIEGDMVTLDFVKRMMEDFKNQKCLHKRYLVVLAYSVNQCILLNRCRIAGYILWLLEYVEIWFLSAVFFLSFRYAFQIVLQTRELLRSLPSLVDITVPDGKHFTVCGDVHGQVTWSILEWIFSEEWVGIYFQTLPVWRAEGYFLNLAFYSFIILLWTPTYFRHDNLKWTSINFHNYVLFPSLLGIDMPFYCSKNLPFYFWIQARGAWRN